MVLQVGDKVLVYGAGTPWAYAKKIEPVKVGDKVDVVTLSDGTKLALPRIALNTDDYVWVIPTWDLPFNIGDIPFSWETIPLGAAVFTVTGVTCRTIQDTLREWEEHVLDGCMLFNWYTNPTTKQTRQQQHEITSHTEQEYFIKASDIPAPMDGGFDFGFEYWNEVTGYPTPEPSGTWHPIYTGNGDVMRTQRLNQRCNLSGAIYISLKWRALFFPSANNATYVDVVLYGIGATKTVRILLQNYSIPNPDIYQYMNNPSYPDYDIMTLELGINSSLYYYDTNTLLSVKADTGRPYDLELDYLHFLDADSNILSEPCIGGVAAGDKYVIYDPVTKRLIFNDSTKLLTDANWVAGGTGAEILSSPIEYVWDGQGHVYLTQSKTTFSTIQFDDMLQVQVVHGSSLEVIAMHLGERITVSGETVSRELTDITSVLTAGNNTITLIARNVDGTKVGFVTPIYVKRSMTVVSL